MAYGAQYFSRLESTSNLDKTLNVKAGMTGSGLQTWSYNALATAANNTKAEVQAADYYKDGYGIVTAGDFILTSCSNGYTVQAVTASTSTTVTTTFVDLA